MSTKPKILVTSAAGKTGLPLAQALLERGFPVRAFVRRDDARAAHLKRAGAEIFIGDQYDLRAMRCAMDGVRRAYQCAPTAPNGLHFNAVFTVAAEEARLEHVVTLGQWLSSADHPSLSTREVYLGDRLIRLPGAIGVTSVDPGWFADNYLMGAEMAAHLGLFAMPLGAGDVAKNAAPSNGDIARVAAAALADPEQHAGKLYRPTGPALMSPDEIAEALGRALGRRVRYMDVSEKIMTRALKVNPPGNFTEAMVAQLAIYAEEYRRGAFAVNAPTDHVAEVTGCAPDPFDVTVQRAIGTRPDLRPSAGRRLAALARFARMLMTRPLDLERVQAVRDHVRLERPAFSQDAPDWVRAHAPLRT